MSQVKRMFARYVSLYLISRIPSVERKGELIPFLIRLVTILEHLPYDEGRRDQLRQLREGLEHHPAAQAIARRAAKLNPKFLFCLIYNLWMRFWLGGKIRDQFRQNEGFEPPYLAVISPLKECNLQCIGCYANAAREKQDKRLDFETMDRIVTELKSYGTPFIVFTGGEPTHPLIWEDIKRICTKHSDQAFMMYTNGTLLDDEKVRDLVELGNLSPAISLEGWQEETDARRGEGVYDKIMAAMDRLRRAGVLFGFSLTYTSKNFEAATSPDLITHLMDKGCLYGWYFMYVPVGKDPDTSLVVTPYERDAIRRFTWEILQTTGLFIADFWNSGHLTMGCIAGGRYLHINNKGDIEPCVFFKFTTHNINDEDTRLIDALRSPLFRRIRENQKGQRNPLRPCQFMDHPKCGKCAVKLSSAHASEEGGEELFSPRNYEFLRQWSEQYRQIADETWLFSGIFDFFKPFYTDPDHWMLPGSKAALHEGEPRVAALRH